MRFVHLKKKMDLSQKDWVSQQEQDSDVVIIDVRSAEEFDSGHLPNAQLLNIQDPQAFMDGIGALDVKKSYYVYCRSGARSAQACLLMNQQGLKNSYNLLGGILEWEGPVV